MRRSRFIVPLIGLIVAIILVLGGVSYKNGTDQQIAAARTNDKTIAASCISNCIALSSLCSKPTLTADVNPRVMGDREDAILTASVTAPASIFKGVTCNYQVDIQVPNFDTQNASAQTVSLTSDNKTAALSWILSPKGAGNWIVAVNLHAESIDPVNSQLGVTVRSQFGLTAGALEILSTLAEILAPILTILSIIDLIRRISKRDSQPSNAITNTRK